ncbi:DUF998 domain-containing protein [Rhodococcus sp. KRD162]|uniref:DUF998 domain-containing protein n=2 Tax=unclassified Rhodococcus (in: high G+C Gram-positive bacteria) TaxID=192944 RepID=UPI0019CFD4E0|nr:DUF998 domain-containing protein [Rhodococcus sp. KRD162]
MRAKTDGVDVRRVLTAVSVILAGLLYSAWVAEFFLDTGLDPTRSFLSELDARDQPYRELFSTADVVTGSLMIVAAVLGFLSTPRRRLLVTGWVASGIFGASTIADAKLPIDCVAADDPSCPIEPSGLFPQLHHLHALTSTIAVFAIFTVMIAFTLAAFRYRIYPLLHTLGIAVLVVTTLATAWLMIADNLPGEYSLGIAQRVQVGGMSAYLVVLGCALRLGAWPSPRPNSPDPR